MSKLAVGLPSSTCASWVVITVSVPGSRQLTPESSEYVIFTTAPSVSVGFEPEFFENSLTTSVRASAAVSTSASDVAIVS